MSLKTITNTVLATLIELCTLVLCLFTYFINLETRNPKKNIRSGSPNHDIPLLFVHGYLHNSSAWIFIRSQLLKEGFINIFTVNLGFPTLKSIEEYAAFIQEKIDEILKLTDQKEIKIIGHSMGGVIACYLAAVQKDQRITNVITIGSPLLGTKLSFLGFGKGTRELFYKSPFTEELCAQIKNTSNTSFFHLGSETDLIVRPTNSAFLGEKKASNVQIFPVMGHVSYLYSSKTVTSILRVLMKV